MEKPTATYILLDSLNLSNAGISKSSNSSQDYHGLELEVALSKEYMLEI